MFSRRKGLFIAAAIAVLLGIFFIPVSYEHIVREGTDRFETHHALWGNRVKSVSEVATLPVRSVGLVLVNLRHAPSIAPASIRVVVDGRGEVAVLKAPLGRDDGFTWVTLPFGAVNAGDRYTIEVSSPDSLVDSPLGIRFDKTSKELALAVRDRVSLVGYVVRWTHEYPDVAHTFFTTLVGGVVLTILLMTIEVIPHRFQKRLWGVLLTMVFLGTIVIRIPLANSIDSAYGGDAFNYLLKSRALIDGQDPFAADPRKAPLYSFLVSPGLTYPFDAIIWERWVSMIAAAGSAVLVSLFLRYCKVPYSLSIAGGVLLAVNRDFQFESVQGLSNTLYAFLVLVSGYTFLIGRPYLVAVYSALATLTRYEGGLVAALLVPASYVVYQLPAKKIFQTIIPLVVLLGIPFMISPFSHSLGVRTLSDIQGDDGLYVAYSFEDFSTNFISFKHFFGRLWVLTPHIGKPFGALGLGIGVGAFGIFLRSRKLVPFLAVAPYILVVCVLAILARGASEQMAYLVQLFSFLVGIGIVVGVWKKPKQIIPILFMIIIQIIAITAILPKTRYYLPVIAFVAIALVGGATLFSFPKKSPRYTLGSLLLVCVIASFSYANAQQAMSGQVSEYNEKSAGQTVLLDAARYVKYGSGIVAVAEGSDLQMRTYLPKERVVIFPDHERDVAVQYEMLKKSDVIFVVDTTENPYFTKMIEAMPEHFREAATFTTRWADITSTLYRVY